jgi:peptidoglycan hydrolase-like protein with peptidoglycan-binding domain
VRIALAGAVDAELVARVQSRLKLLGYAPGGIDGKIGPQTIAAVRAFQREHGMAADGVIDAALLSRLTEQGALRTPAAPPPRRGAP